MTGQPFVRRPAWGQTYKIGWLEILDLVNYSSVNVLENLGRPLVPSVICQQCQHPMIQAQLINKPANRSILLESKVAAFSDPNTIPNSLTIRQYPINGRTVSFVRRGINLKRADGAPTPPTREPRTQPQERHPPIPTNSVTLKRVVFILFFN